MASSSSGKECGVCNEDFNEKRRCPRNLPCSHCICEDCIVNIIRKNDKRCPFCRQSFPGSLPRDFPVNTTTLELVKYTSYLEEKISSPTNVSDMSRSVLVEELKRKSNEAVKKNITECQLTEEQIQVAIQTTLKLQSEIQQNRNAIQDGLMSKIKKIDEISELQIKFLEDERGRLETQLKDREGMSKMLNTAKFNLEAANNLQKVDTAIDNADEIINTTQKGLQELMNSVSKQVKVYEALKKTTENAQDKIKLMHEVLISFQEEGWNLEPHKDPLQLQNEVPLYLTHQEAMTLVNTSTRVAFLDFATNAVKLGRLHISLTPGSLRAQNFALLCSGELGPSFLYTNILYVRNKEEAGEIIQCGDYLKNTGKEGKALVQGAGLETGEAFEKAYTAGILTGWSNESDEEGSLFGIITKSKPNSSVTSAFGKVVSGLQVLNQAVSRYSNINDVKIFDCGLLLPTRLGLSQVEGNPYS